MSLAGSTLRAATFAMGEDARLRLLQPPKQVSRLGNTDFILDGEPSRISPCAALHFVGRQWPAARHLKRSPLMALGEI
jgi:hypothetical protein